ncbi:ATP-dependent DNA ligase [Bradyrhizobium sp. RDM12]
MLGIDGVSDFNALHSQKHDGGVQLYAFDLPALDGDDLRKLPLSMRKTSLSCLLRGPEGIFISPFELGEIGPDLFQAAVSMGLEGLVSKRRDRPYQAGRSKEWIKVKNRTTSSDDQGVLRWLTSAAHGRTVSRDRSPSPPPDREPDLNAGLPWSEMAEEDLRAAWKTGADLTVQLSVSRMGGDHGEMP